MRTLFLTAWLLLPLAAIAYHYGPGRQQLLVDDVGRLLVLAEGQVAAGHQREAIGLYRQALERMPETMVHRQRQVRLELARLEMTSQMLPEAYLGLTSLVDEVHEDPQADPQFTRQAEAALANAQYYLTWLLRLEGAPQEVWEPEIEAARQTFRELAETAQQAEANRRGGAGTGVAVTAESPSRKNAASSGGSEENGTAEGYRRDLEAVIRLARMDLDELQGLPLPCQCRGCCSGSVARAGKCKGKGKSEGGQRREDARGASSGPPPDDSGS